MRSVSFCPSPPPLALSLTAMHPGIVLTAVFGRAQARRRRVGGFALMLRLRSSMRAIIRPCSILRNRDCCSVQSGLPQKWPFVRTKRMREHVQMPSDAPDAVHIRAHLGCSVMLRCLARIGRHVGTICEKAVHVMAIFGCVRFQSATERDQSGPARPVQRRQTRYGRGRHLSKFHRAGVAGW